MARISIPVSDPKNNPLIIKNDDRNPAKSLSLSGAWRVDSDNDNEADRPQVRPNDTRTTNRVMIPAGG